MDKERKEIINTYLIGAKSGDRQCLDKLYAEMSATIRHIALKYLQNEEDAKDLVQDFWADFYRIASGYVFSRNAFGYLCKVATRMAINRYKSLYKKRIKEIQWVDYEQYQSGATSVESIEIKICIENAMKKLTVTERIIIQSTYFEEKTVREIAKELRISKSQVSKLKQSAINKMKQELEKDFVDN